MEIFVLGSGVGVPNEKRSYPGIFVESAAGRVLIDPGPGSMRQLLKAGFGYKDVDSIIFTHFHPDHCLDFVSFLFACKYPLEPRKKDLFVLGPPGLKSFYGGMADVFKNAITPEMFRLHLKEMSEGVIADGKAEVAVKPVAHSDSAIGVRYKDGDGKVFCYSGDTDYCLNIVELARNADLLIAECSFPDEGKVDGHLTPSLAGRIAKEANVKKLVLTHLYPVCEGRDAVSQCRKEFSGDVEAACDLMRVKIA